MKNKLTLLAITLLLISGIYAQAPDLINYQAVARDASGIPLLSQPVSVTFSIRQGSSSGTVVYSETHASNTNPFGLFTLQIGGGTPVTGTFAGINWGTGLYYLEVTVNGDVMPTSQLLSVPYALHANTASSGTPGANGHNGLSAITAEPAGSNCPNGGYLVEVGVDDNDNGTLEALEIDFSYYVCNGLDGAANSNDTSATNELQMLSISNDTIFLSNGGFVKLPPALGDDWGSQVVATTGANILGDGTTLTPLMVIDNDTSATNELELPTTATTNDVLTWNGTAWVASAPVSGADNWGTQVVITSGGNISGDGTPGNPLTVTDNDTSATNELQNLSITGNTINISGGTGTNLSVIAPSTGEYLYWNGVNWVPQAIPAGDNWGTQVAVVSGGNISGDGTSGNPITVTDNDTSATNEIQNLTVTTAYPNVTVGISGGSSYIFSVNDADFDPTNEYNTSFGVNGANLELVDGGNTFQVPLSTLSDGDWTVSGTDLLNANAGNVGIGPMFGGAPGFLSTTGKVLTIAPTNVYNSSNPASLELVGSNTSATGISGRLAFGHITAGPTAVYEGGIDMNVGSDMMFFTNGANERMRINSSGNVGIGTTAPLERLHVMGNIRTDNGTDHMYLGQSGSSSVFVSDNLMELLPNSGGVAFSIDDGDANFYVNTHIDNGLQIQDGNEALNRILTSDAFGNATWSDLSAISSGATAWTKSGNVIYPTTLTDNIGIGTTTPGSRLHIVGSGLWSSFISLQHNEEWAMGVNGTSFLVVKKSGTTFTPLEMTNGGNTYFRNITSGDIMTLLNSGLVGIGTTTPAAQIQVEATTIERASQFLSSFASNSDKYGLYALAQGGGAGENIGVQGEAVTATTNKAIVGRAFGGSVNWAGFFEVGDVHINDDLRIGTTNAGSAGAKIYTHIPSGSAKYSTMESLNEYNGNQMMYGHYNRMIASGTGGVTGTWNYITPSASSSNTVYGFRSLIQVGGNGARYGSYQFVNADGTGEVNGVYANVNHDGSGNVYGLRADVSSSTTTGIVRGLWVVGTTGTINYVGGAGFGVGVQTPQNKLDVEGAAVIGATYSGTNVAPVNGLLVAGDVGIGTVSPASKLHVEGTTTSNAGHFDNWTTNGGTGVRGETNQNNATGTGTRYGVYGAAWYGQGTNYGMYGYGFGGTNSYGVYGTSGGASGNNYGIYCSGNGAYTGSWTNVSDRKFKQNIVPFTSALSKVMQLEAKEYDYTDDERYAHMNFSKEKQIGFIAQEVEKIFPNLVEDGIHPGKLNKETGEEGEPINYKGMNYIGLIPILTKAIQEQQQMIDELRKELDELKNK
ncbi:MAG: tail fiber domain-containing protein [Flavobacteriales bacterium]|nr:tail fiber domain-containing protein [Flavobacteriales bacterium]